MPQCRPFQGVHSFLLADPQALGLKRPQKSHPLRHRSENACICLPSCDHTTCSSRAPRAHVTLTWRFLTTSQNSQVLSKAFPLGTS